MYYLLAIFIAFGRYFKRLIKIDNQLDEIERRLDEREKKLRSIRKQ
ncbi:MAG: hypothetical protein BWY19_01153 [bacterium ADurb.Bin212]|jgi:hypothetical protein|nr:MAG: hypothetical protein BWY19_01153 [bacterium ADurb.Bin212]